MREIPPLQVLCLRSVGPHSCSVEATFAPTKKDPKEGDQPSTASRLLRSLHTTGNIAQVIQRTPCIGTGSSRRLNANDVDMFHPLGTEPIDDNPNNSDVALVYVHGNPASDCLQSYIDSLVELGRMDDQRLGLHFFEEWKNNVVLAAAAVNRDDNDDTVDGTSRKRRRDQDATIATASSSVPVALGALSLFNCNIAQDTFDNMKEAKIGQHLATLDLSGIRGLTDDLLSLLLPECPNLQHLALKNCRRITNITVVGKHQKQLTTLDVGGCFNITTDHVLQMVPLLPHMTKLHASGLGWTDLSMNDLVLSQKWEHLSLSFSMTLTQGALRNNILPLAETLTALGLAFCETVMDNAAMGLLGRNLPYVKALDLRGNPALSTLTGWYDGRVSANLSAQPLTVLGRYSGLSESSVEETKRVHPLETAGLVVILDGGGMGAAIEKETDADEEEES